SATLEPGHHSVVRIPLRPNRSCSTQPITMTRPLTLQDILNPLDTNQVVNQPPISVSTRDGDTCNPLENRQQNTASPDENDVVITNVTTLQNPANRMTVHPTVRPRKPNSKPDVSKLLDVS